MPITMRMEVQLSAEQQACWARLAARWGCTIEQAMERAALEMLDQLPDEQAAVGNVIKFPGPTIVDL